MESNDRTVQGPLLSIVDDDASSRNSARRLARLLGFQAEAFASAQEFLNSGHVGNTACLILDLRLPGMGGLELQRFLSVSGHRIPIVFVSGHASEDEQRRAMQAGAADFLCKPVSQEALASAIQRCCGASPETQDG
jgi:FixJ family two-component response regulator